MNNSRINIDLQAILKYLQIHTHTHTYIYNIYIYIIKCKKWIHILRVGQLGNMYLKKSVTIKNDVQSIMKEINSLTI